MGAFEVGVLGTRLLSPQRERRSKKKKKMNTEWLKKSNDGGVEVWGKPLWFWHWCDTHQRDGTIDLFVF